MGIGWPKKDGFTNQGRGFVQKRNLVADVRYNSVGTCNKISLNVATMGNYLAGV